MADEDIQDVATAFLFYLELICHPKPEKKCCNWLAAAKEIVQDFLGNNPGLERAFSTISMALEKIQEYIRGIILRVPLP